MSETKYDTSGGTTFVSMLTVAFIVLKILGKITWSWWWVLSPMWLSFAFALAVLLVVSIVYGIILIVSKYS